MNTLRNVLGCTLLAFCVSGAAQDACTQSERQIWSCEANGKFYTLCASSDLGPQTGYMQYRVYQKAALEFAYPASHRHPRGLFKLSLLSKGAAMTFSNGGYQYEIYEPLAGSTEIAVTKARKKLADIRCSDFSDTLTLTSTQDFLATVGIYEK